MNLHSLLLERQREGRPVRVAMIGAGKFGSMFLAQLRITPGLHLIGLADLDASRARQALESTGWDPAAYGARSLTEAETSGTTFITEDSDDLLTGGPVEVVVDATGNPAAGIRHALSAAENGKHIVMVNVEADVLAGPLLAERCRQAGVVYSMAYGDQPALICEQVDWARACGLNVVAAGKGTKYLPVYHASTPDTVWPYYGLTAERAAQGGMNPQMFNSFLDGTKSSIEMAAVANATGLATPSNGLAFPPCSVDELPVVLRPASEGGTLEKKGQVEVISSLQRNGDPVIGDLRWGVYVVFEAPSDYTARCFSEYGLVTDPSGRYGALYRPYHLIGLELGVSVASVAIRGEPTGTTRQWSGDVAAVAKSDLKAGQKLDGEGGFCVWGKLLPASESIKCGALPIGLAHGVTLQRDIKAGEIVCWSDLEAVGENHAVSIRREMEERFAPSA
ncbi:MULTISPECIES: NAD(P)H-dependent oxidoreductase [Limibacillus]|jgi:predicted homoserine dehydrogenase-like protein|uniref:Putative homoserine dehydrogenase-like protein n=1 Tax=Limibacillus halophilus TaxID=1579333 RepID=A0A839SWI5_9PROT|nr:Gfo/Idh/MocA family oxidoreductase [Limibacillus halophilus]MBB3066399.1 putative homoserine dehydrogenase-like protein [Limibacillus halophilus]